ncbi:hypothetical protein FB451DRAFT_1563720 [Mycena latifolia]|nr:hypothetical protein FB451DRAFT_1563720 [Mycena latifolia]
MSGYRSVHLSDPEHTYPLEFTQPNENDRTAVGSEFVESRFDLRAAESEKSLAYDTSARLQRNHSFAPRAFLWMLLGWPALVICAQVIIQVLAWGFFALVQSRGSIPLPYSTASWAKANPRILTLLSTLVSTGLAAYSTFLFSFGVRQSVALYLRQPMSLATFVSTIGISSRSLVLDPKKWKWSAMSISVVALTGVQTSAWSTFLTPVEIVIQTAVGGTELDLSSRALRQMYSSSPETFANCIVNSSLESAFFVGGTDSGYALAKHNMGYPASFTLMDQTFNVSAAGILPATLRNVNASTWFPHMTVIPSLRGLDDVPRGFSSNYTMTQQGFSADVTCEFKDLNIETTPSLDFRADTVKDWNNFNFTGSAPGVVRYSEISSNCPVVKGFLSNFTWAFTTTPNYVLMLPCGAAANYTLIFVWSGIYQQPPIVCTVSPKITKVNVDYSDSHSISGTISTTVLDGGVWDPDGPAGLAAITAMSNTVFNAQAAFTNVMGSQIKSLVTDVNDYNTANTSLRSTEAYIQGVAEYSGSILRACLSGKNATFVEGVPAGMTVATNGTIFTETLGWTRHGSSSIWVLIPGSVIALATIIVVIAAVAHHASAPPQDPFDPADPMHLMAVVAAGGLSDAFTGTSKKDIKAAEDTKVILQSFPGRGPALVRTLHISG